MDRLADGFGLTFDRTGRSVDTARGSRGDTLVTLLKPKTYMNRSGEALREAAHGEPLVTERTLVVSDDFALPLGKLRLRARGGDGGHNGLRSLITVFATESFPRLRLGVGPVPEGVDPADFVLEPFDPTERERADAMVERATACVESVLRIGVEKSMAAFNASPPDDD